MKAMKAKFYSDKKVSRYVKRLDKNGYRIKYDFDTDGVYYYSVQVYNRMGHFVGEFSTPKTACDALCADVI